jgi:hypothetical protein
MTSNELNVSINVSLRDDTGGYTGDTEHGEMIAVGTITDDGENYREDLIPHLIALGLLPDGYQNEA